MFNILKEIQVLIGNIVIAVLQHLSSALNPKKKKDFHCRSYCLPKADFLCFKLC